MPNNQKETGISKHQNKEQNTENKQMKINIGNDVFIINHSYTGTHTIQEVYEDFLKRAITNS